MALPPTFVTAKQPEDLLPEAIRHHSAGNLAEAEKLYRQILSQNPNQHDALHLLGMLAGNVGQFDPGIDLVRRAISVSPNQVVFMLTLSDLQIKSRRFADAIETCQTALRIKSDNPEMLNHLGISFSGLRRFDEGIEAYRKSIRLNPNLAETHGNLAGAFKEKRQLDEALSEIRIALRIKPESPIFHFTLGEIYMLRLEHASAEPEFRTALAAMPGLQSARFGLGAALMKMQRADEAIAVFNELLQANPQYPEVWNWIGVTLWEKGSIQGAIDSFRKAIQIDPNSEWGHFSLSNVLLLLGDFENGLNEYEWRPLIKFQKPVWDGSPLNGKNILLYVEQGFGDIIQFVRYAAMVKARGAGQIILGCHACLNDLMKTNPAIDQAIETIDEKTPYDVQLPLMSLPRIFKTRLDSIPAEVPYLFANPAAIKKWDDKLSFPKDKLKVGLVWAGRASHKSDDFRSMKLAQFAPLAKARNTIFYSLQRDRDLYNPADAPSGMEIIDVGPDIQDFTDSAAIVSQLDLVITVDTSTAHLAGAMGKPTWILIRSAVPEWRWLLDRSDSPWYPTVRLFRQQAPGHWTQAVQNIADELVKLAK